MLTTIIVAIVLALVGSGLAGLLIDWYDRRDMERMLRKTPAERLRDAGIDIHHS